MRRQSHISIRGLLALLPLLILALPQPAQALLAAHQAVAGCDTCHRLHGSPTQSGGLLSELSPEATCLSCHGPLGPATRKATIHGTAGQITCLECHNPHNNDHLNAAGGYNIMLVGMEYDANRSATGVVSHLPKPQVREETPTATPGETVLGALKDVVFEASPDDWHRPINGDGVCNICHGAGLHNEGKDCVGCHAHDGGFAGAGCTGCHSTKAAGDAGVGVDSPHVKVGKATGYNTFVDCTDCHSGHADGTTGANDVEIATTLPTFNAKYTSHAATGAIQLGGAKTSGSSEAEICWNCHQNDTYQGTGVDISEWDGTHATYNYGSVTAGNLNWLTTNWSSAQFTYKNGKLTNKPTVADPVNGATNGGSTHGVMGGASGVDSVTKIGCSACHDVHDTGGGVNNGVGPFLRGSWTQNPFPEDGAPRSGVASYAATDFGGVPRGGTGLSHPLSWAGNNKPGGWQIEQNNSPFSWTDYPTGAGLCNSCHTASSIESALTWTGHNAVVPGFGGSDVASNIFTTTKRGGNGTYLRGNMRHANTSAYTSTWVYGLRSVEAGSGKNPPQYGIAPKINPGRPETGTNLNLANLLGVSVDSGTTDSNYHYFPCAKCHNPHASRLPKLMITNCLDVKINTWDDTINPTTWTPISGTNGHTAKQLAYASSATNCHRYVSSGDLNRETNGSNENGWNSVTPW